MISTVLQYGNSIASFKFKSVVDSGAENCIFPAKFGTSVGINVQKGPVASSLGIGGLDHVYYHDVTVWAIIENRPWHFTCKAGFSTSLDQVSWGLLGRLNFFDLFEEVIFDQKHHMLKLQVEGIRPKKKKDHGPLANFLT